MTSDPNGSAVARELRDLASSFVNNHVDLWVTVDDDGTLSLAANDPAALFRAAADWLTDDPDHTVADARWETRTAEPVHTLRLVLRPLDVVRASAERAARPV